MTFPNQLKYMRQYKEKVLDTKSASFCGAKWYHTSIWLWNGWTASCHHNPPHVSDLEEIKIDPSALHNTAKKKQERAMMQIGERPLDCQYCWVLEDQGSDELAHRTWYSQVATDQELQAAFDAPADQRVVPKYVELGIDRTCNLACSYCCPDISSSWSRDIKRNGPYQGIVTDERNHYIDSGKYLYGTSDSNPYADAFFTWWDSELQHHVKTLKITGGEPFMSQHFWRLMEHLAHNSDRKCIIDVATNLSYDSETLTRFLDLAAKSKRKWKISISNESVGAKAEYVRDGLNWQQWEANLIQVINSKLFSEITILTTISAISIDGLVEFVDWLSDLKKKGNFWLLKIYLSYVRWPTFQSMLILPLELRTKYSDDIKECVSRNQRWLSSNEQDFLMTLSRYLVTSQQPHRGSFLTQEKIKFDDQLAVFDVSALQQDFKRFFQQYDVRRDKNFAETFPNLKQWYESIQI